MSQHAKSGSKTPDWLIHDSRHFKTLSRVAGVGFHPTNIYKNNSSQFQIMIPKKGWNIIQVILEPPRKDPGIAWTWGTCSFSGPGCSLEAVAPKAQSRWLAPRPRQLPGWSSKCLAGHSGVEDPPGWGFALLSYTRYIPRWFGEKPWPTFRCPLAYCNSARLWEDLANLSLPSAKHNFEAQVKDLAFFDSGSLADLGIQTNQTSTAMAFDTNSVTHLPGRRQATRWYPQPKLVACPAQPIPIISDISTAPATPHGFQGSAG